MNTEMIDTIKILKNVQESPVADKQAFVASVWKTISGTLGSKKKDAKLITLFTWFWGLVFNNN